MPNLTRKERPIYGWVTETILPDESDEEFNRLSTKLIEELSPKTGYALSLATDIVYAIWDIHRHRRIVTALVRSEFKRQAEAALPTPRHRRDLDELPDIGRRLLERDPDALNELAGKGLSLSEITAAAYDARSSSVAYHETRIADLERRRDRLFDAYNRVQPLSKSAEIEDAEEIG